VSTVPSLKQPWYRYRPVKVRRTGGGRRATFDETISGVTPVTIYGVMRVHDTFEEIIVEGDAEVLVDDHLRLRED